MPLEPIMTFTEAAQKLQNAGMLLTPSDIPGLTWVNGHELTMHQVIDIALKLSGR